MLFLGPVGIWKTTLQGLFAQPKFDVEKSSEEDARIVILLTIAKCCKHIKLWKVVWITYTFHRLWESLLMVLNMWKTPQGSA